MQPIRRRRINYGMKENSVVCDYCGADLEDPEDYDFVLGRICDDCADKRLREAERA